MELKIMSWNMAGAKVLEHLDSPPDPAPSSYISAFKDVWEESIKQNFCIHRNEPNLPDVILLQECIGFLNHSESPSKRWYDGDRILNEIFKEYDCYFFPAFSSYTNPHPGRWKKYERGNDIPNYLPPYVEAQQGYGVCIRNQHTNQDNDIQLRKIWIDEENQKLIRENDDLPKKNEKHFCFEAISMTSGLYLGNRNTEPRLVVMGRALINQKRYLNFLNVHLTTLQGERDGNIRINRSASKTRLQQLDLILNEIVSPYQAEKNYRLRRRPIPNEESEDIWVIAGDFNATEDSEELTLMKQVGFVDGIDSKKLIDTSANHRHDGKIGTKWSLRRTSLPPVSVDYIFCGLERTSFGINACDVSKSRRPLRPKFNDTKFESDHAVLYATFKI